MALVALLRPWEIETTVIMMSLVDDTIKNPDASRVLVLALASEAARSDKPVDAKELAISFSRLVRSLDRKAFTDECRKLQRLGPKRYLQVASDLIGK